MNTRIRFALAALIALAAPSTTAGASPTATLTNQEIASRAQHALTEMRSIKARFIQTNPDGTRLNGNLFLERPGRIRFDYDSPAPLEVIADGSQVIVRDRRLGTQDLFPIGQTPLRFLLGESVVLGGDLALVSSGMSPQGAFVVADSSSGLGGKARITLLFDESVSQLRAWTIVDAQGFTTNVSIGEVVHAPHTDRNLFDIRFSRPLS